MSSLIVEVCEVKEVRHHPNADRLDIVRIKGWDCIVGRDNYVPGELVIFVPPDSILPQDVIERWEVNYLKSKIGRVGVIKLRGEYSYGLVLDNIDGHPKGKDVAEIYGITKWLPPSERDSKGKRHGRRGDKWQRNPNPYFRKYTRIEHFRNYEEVLEEGEYVVITEKIHGTNFRAGWVPRQDSKFVARVRKLFGLDNYEFVVGSHNVQLDDPHQKTYYGSNIYHNIATKLGLRRLPKGWVVYGEIFGPGVQDMSYGREALDVRFYDVLHVKHGNIYYLNHATAEAFLIGNGLEMVPVIYQGTWDEDVLKLLYKYFEDEKSYLDEDTILEGAVVTPGAERDHPLLGRVILKIINPAYLTRKKGTENK
jgi:RNA ligase (TIGR02306 family)